MFSEPASGDSFLSKAVMLQPPKTASPTGGQSVSIPEVMGHTTFSRHFIKLSESKKGEGGVFCFVLLFMFLSENILSILKGKLLDGLTGCGLLASPCEVKNRAVV